MNVKSNKNESREDAMDFETLKVRREGAVLFVEIAAPPMHLLGPELVRDLELYLARHSARQGRAPLGNRYCHSHREITMHPLRKLRESGNATPAQVSALLAENIVFNSPILVRPIQGREVIAAIFAQSSSTRGSGTYTAEFKLDERTTFLRWEGTMEGHKIESLEVIVDNEQGLIVERTIALRPYPAVKLFRDAMYASLKDKLPPDVWDYPTP
jgi:hypothetical protein